MEKKYELTNEFINFDGKKLYRIKALRSFGNVKAGEIEVKAGELGGYIESEVNLSHEGNCWVFDNAWVYENAQVFGNAIVSGEARVFGNAIVFGKAELYENAKVYGNAQVFEEARVSGEAEVYGNARVFGNAIVYGNAEVFGEAEVYGNVLVYETIKQQDFSLLNKNSICYKFNEDKILEELKQYIDSTYSGHYSKDRQFQAAEFIFDSGHGIGFCLGNVMKYAQRYGHKGTNADARKDLLKVIHYAMMALYQHDQDAEEEINNEIFEKIIKKSKIKKEELPKQVRTYEETSGVSEAIKKEFAL